MAVDVDIEVSWRKVLAAEFEEPYFRELTEFVKQEYKERRIYPRGRDIFRAFALTPFDKVRVVLLGQDPYHGPGQAHGLCFSVPDRQALPPSLQNIFKELKQDLGRELPESGNLTSWAERGVLLLNAILTVRASSPGSHQQKGWEQFTDRVIGLLSEQRTGLVFLLWGAYARRKRRLIDTEKHLVLEAAHPSPLSVGQGFFGCRHFSKANRYLGEDIF